VLIICLSRCQRNYTGIDVISGRSTNWCTSLPQMGAKGDSKPDIQWRAFKLRIGAVEFDPVRRK